MDSHPNDVSPDGIAKLLKSTQINDPAAHDNVLQNERPVNKMSTRSQTHTSSSKKLNWQPIDLTSQAYSRPTRSEFRSRQQRHSSGNNFHNNQNINQNFTSPRNPNNYGPGPSHHFQDHSQSQPRRRPPFSGGIHSSPRNAAPPMSFETFMTQGKYLDELSQRVFHLSAILQEELDNMYKFKDHLERACRTAFHRTFPESPSRLALIPYGSCASGFGTKGSDMDLILSWDPAAPPPTEDQAHLVPRLLEGAILDADMGARLLTNTRVPVLKVCQTPPTALRQALRDARSSWEKEREIEENVENRDSIVDSPTKSVDESKLDGSDEHKPDDLAGAKKTERSTPRRTRTRIRDRGPLDFPPNESGIQADISFDISIGVHNTLLQQCYKACDPRVAQMIVFVKTWAKTRGINSAYSGSLSSYGWVLMVLHFLINVARPPVLPNIQTDFPPRAQPQFSHNYRIDFDADVAKFQRLGQAGQFTQNKEPVGLLLRGFFNYYSHQGRDHLDGGFNWKNDVISIRDRGGLISKVNKGWTGATTQEHNGVQVRQRYLFAIECPLETNHNVARTVTHDGIVAIRGELRRAWSILTDVGNHRISHMGGLMDQYVDPVVPSDDRGSRPSSSHKNEGPRVVPTGNLVDLS